MSHNRIQSLFDRLTADNPPFLPTELYCEGWLLRLVLDWFEESQIQGHALSFASDACWYSEPSLESPFLYNNPEVDKPIKEGYTRGDGVIGHVQMAIDDTKSKLGLLPSASQFLVLEAKISSSLSYKVTNAPFYDQAARNIACLAQICMSANVLPSNIDAIGFYILGSDKHIERGLYRDLLTTDHIKSTVKRRVEMYDGTKTGFCHSWT
ncbi:MAG: hypothetical protein AAFN11_11405 [Chloroflexota bacterium]